jgi:hypothetical protein
MGLFGGLLMALTAVAGLSPLAAVEITLPAI